MCVRTHSTLQQASPGMYKRKWPNDETGMEWNGMEWDRMDVVIFQWIPHVVVVLLLLFFVSIMLGEKPRYVLVASLDSLSG